MAVFGTAAVVWLMQFDGGGSITYRTMLAWMVSAALTGWALLIGEVIPLRLPERYFDHRSNEIRLYRKLKVPTFGRFLRWAPCSFIIGGGEAAISDPTSIKQINQLTRRAEFLHLLALVLCLVPLGYWMWKGWWWGASWLAVFNVFFNAYPIMLQRYNRFRLSRLFQEAGEAGWALEEFVTAREKPQNSELEEKR